MNGFLALLAILTVAFMLGVLIWFVPHHDLIVVLVGSLLLLAWDFWTQLRPGRRGQSG